MVRHSRIEASRSFGNRLLAALTMCSKVSIDLPENWRLLLTSRQSQIPCEQTIVKTVGQTPFKQRPQSGIVPDQIPRTRTRGSQGLRDGPRHGFGRNGPPLCPRDRALHAG